MADRHQLLDKLQTLRGAFDRMKLAHAEFVSWLSQEPAEGWVATPAGVLQLDSVPEEVLRIVDTLEYTGSVPTRLPGLVKIAPTGRQLLLEVNAARAAFDLATRFFRFTRGAELERLPEGTDLGGGQLAAWQSLSQRETLWRPAAAFLGVPRLSLLQITRLFVADGVQDDELPMRVGFCWTFQPKSELLMPEQILVELDEIAAGNLDNAFMVEQDRRALSEFANRYPGQPLAKMSGSNPKPSVNLAWSDGRKPARRIAAMPVFWTGPCLPRTSPIPFTPPESSTRMKRRDRKYAEEPLLRTLNVHAPSNMPL
ncbi:TPA: hypothetical protein ACKP1E_000499 [Pseudomonas aeruginosa]|uniref:hypothetical protein n=1 Tax=Pseudomonas aeruginosa TaxID=287 RepID=UPI000BB55AF5|nr:hypothetical protein [Pseudomonas aeruginosa]MBG6687080.1 hypothetical protein [Pseudomonas aeruginosa]MBG6722983.1 hypothetical protein [Pseudomonas aeruginosa]MBH9013228.1 hypothetical protein [Pseudomonas aeruginosa]MBN5533090.1 hypothetical protein [Pseudomonas aeruginosa]MCV4014184.1 hypothetical protein [Pseudomonas aeruginosa]